MKKSIFSQSFSIEKFFNFIWKAVTNTVTQVANYNAKTKSCELVRVTLEGKKCNSSPDCKDLSLGCDPTINTCKRGYLVSCLADSDCLSTEKCINQLCDCVGDFLIIFNFHNKIFKFSFKFHKAIGILLEIIFCHTNLPSLSVFTIFTLWTKL